MPQVLERLDLGHKAQLFPVGLPSDELDSHRRGAMQDALVHLQARKMGETGQL